jgi:hypothetical protein
MRRAGRDRILSGRRAADSASWPTQRLAEPALFLTDHLKTIPNSSRDALVWLSIVHGSKALKKAVDQPCGFSTTFVHSFGLSWKFL